MILPEYSDGVGGVTFRYRLLFGCRERCQDRMTLLM